ncbi:MAG: CarD family transcriptional regulator [Erysipelotrichales bacterium]
MYEIDQIISYGNKGLCKIVDIIMKEVNNKEIPYYILKPVYEEDSTIFIPQDNKKLTDKFQELITKKEIYSILENVSSHTLLLEKNSKSREIEYKELLETGTHIDLLKLIIMLYNKKEEESKLTMIDSNAFKEAEKKLYREIAFVLDIELENVEPFIKNYYKN